MKAFLTQVPLAETATSTVRVREDALAAAAAEVARQESRVDAKAAQLVTLATLAAAAGLATRVDQMAGLVLRRYRAVRVAVDLLTAGFVPLLGTGLAALATVVLTGGPS